MTDKGADLNNRVWTLFEQAGFSTKPNSLNPQEAVVRLAAKKRRPIDLLATDPKLGVKIVGQNTTKRDVGSWTGYVADCENIKKAASANAMVVVLTEKEVNADDVEYAKSRGIQVWGSQQLDYFSALVDTIDTYAKFEIINSLGIRTSEEKTTYHALALRFCQPLPESGVNLFVFPFPPEKLLRTSCVFRKAHGSAAAYQRMLRKKRVQGVLKFLDQHQVLLPTNIIVHFDESVTWDAIPTPERDVKKRPLNLAREDACELVRLNIPLRYASLEVIDGQHRLFGFARAQKRLKERFNLVVTGIAQLPSGRRRDTFVAINDKSRRMDPNLVAFLKYTDDEDECRNDNELMAIRIVVELSRTTPFKHAIRLLDIGDEVITLKGFCGYDLRGLVGKKGLLRKCYGHDSREYVSALRIYFSVLRSSRSRLCALLESRVQPPPSTRHWRARLRRP